MDARMMRLRRLARQFLNYGSHYLYVMDCEALPDIHSPQGEAITVIDGASLAVGNCFLDDLIKLNPDNGPYVDEVRKSRMVCVVITYDRQVVHYGFLYLRNRMGCLLGLPSDALLAGNAYTVPSYRGRGCQGRSMLARAAYARDAGFRKVMAETAPDNVASGRGLRKAGMVMLGRVNYLVLLRYAVFRFRRPPGFPALGLCIG